MCDQKALNVKSQIYQANRWKGILHCEDSNCQLLHQPFNKIIKTWEGKIQEYLSTPNLLSWTFLARNFVPMILSLYHGSTIYLKSTFDTIFDAITSRLRGSPSYVINVHILTSLPPFKDIISHSSHLIYIAGKSWIIVISSLLPLQSDFLWFLIIFRAPQKWFLETLNVFNFIPPAWKSNQANWFFSSNQP